MVVKFQLFRIVKNQDVEIFDIYEILAIAKDMATEGKNIRRDSEQAQSSCRHVGGSGFESHQH